jgi:hypothetical protein
MHHTLALHKTYSIMPLRTKLPLPRGAALAVLIAATGLLLLTTTLIELPVLRHTKGRVLFPVDQAFLNSSIGRNLAFYQVWGITKYSFQSASSSLLYPLVLAPVFFIAGPYLVIPLIINLLAAVFLLYRLQQTLIRRNYKPQKQLLILLAAMALTCLPLLVVSGMEYTLQLLTLFLFIDALNVILKTGGPITREIYAYAALAVAARYEDAIIIILACIILTTRRGWRPAAKLVTLALSPILLFGVLSITKGSYFLPNSLLRDPFSMRDLRSLAQFQQNCRRMYDQQYLTAGFVHRYYYRSSVGIDEPGAISWFSEGRKLDFTGIANRDVIRSKRMHYWSPVYADSLSRLDGIRAAIVADPWFSAYQLPKWDRIASWNIPDGGPVPGPPKTITFYAIDEWDTTNLRRNLHEYEHLLPAGVAVRYY